MPDVPVHGAALSAAAAAAAAAVSADSREQLPAARLYDLSAALLRAGLPSSPSLPEALGLCLLARAYDCRADELAAAAAARRAPSPPPPAASLELDGLTPASARALDVAASALARAAPGARAAGLLLRALARSVRTAGDWPLGAGALFVRADVWTSGGVGARLAALPAKREALADTAAACRRLAPLLQPASSVAPEDFAIELKVLAHAVARIDDRLRPLLAAAAGAAAAPRAAAPAARSPAAAAAAAPAAAADADASCSDDDEAAAGADGDDDADGGGAATVPPVASPPLPPPPPQRAAPPARPFGSLPPTATGAELGAGAGGAGASGGLLGRAFAGLTKLQKSVASAAALTLPAPGAPAPAPADKDKPTVTSLVSALSHSVFSAPGGATAVQPAELAAFASAAARACDAAADVLRFSDAAAAGLALEARAGAGAGAELDALAAGLAPDSARALAGMRAAARALQLPGARTDLLRFTAFCCDALLPWLLADVALLLRRAVDTGAAAAWPR
jgi:hypothetical protein